MLQIAIDLALYDSCYEDLAIKFFEHHLISIVCLIPSPNWFFVVSPVVQPSGAEEDSAAPVLLSQDGYGLYDKTFNSWIRQVATAHQIPLQLRPVSGFGSDGSIALRDGHVLRTACLSFPTQNIHGYEVAHFRCDLQLY